MACLPVSVILGGLSDRCFSKVSNVHVIRYELINTVQAIDFLI